MASSKVELRDLVRAKRRMRGLGLHDASSSRPSPTFKCRPVLVNTMSSDEKGCLVLADGYLVAVLVRVAAVVVGQDGKELSGWHMEAGFGRCAVPVPLVFDTLADAVAWMRTQLSARQAVTARP